MQTNDQTLVAAQPVPSIETVAAITSDEAAKRASVTAALQAKRLANIQAGLPANAGSVTPAVPAKRAKRSKAKPAAKQSASAKPTQAERDATREASHSQRSDEKLAAAKAVAAYIGPSKPFKSASDTFAPINLANQKPGPLSCRLGTVRQAVLLLAMLQYGAGNIKPSGQFVRGGFRVPARLINPKAPADAFLAAQPESGCLGNTLGLTTAYVSGPTSGAGQRDAIYRINFNAVRKLLAEALGEPAVKAANVFIAGFGVAADKRKAA